MALAKIYITLKKGVLDPQGRAVKDGLEALGFEGVEDVRVGKYLEVQLKDSPQETLEASAREMCRRLLANPVIENYRVEIESPKEEGRG